MADCRFPSNTTSEAMRKELWDLYEAFQYAYCEGYIRDLREGLEVKQNTTPVKVVQRKPKIGTRHNRSNKKASQPRTVCARTPEWLAVTEAKIIQQVREMLEEMLFAKYMESRFRVKRIVGLTPKSMGN